MSFFDIKPVEEYKSYIDRAFGKASRRASQMKIVMRWTDAEKARNKESTRLRIVKDVLTAELEDINKRFPVVTDLNEFYRRLTEVMIDIDRFKKSLSQIGWARKKIDAFFKLYGRRLKLSKDITTITSCRREFYGRVNSVMSNIKEALEFLDSARKEFRKFPIVKEIFSVAIVGFPNVGKSTLLFKLSGSKPEIAEYPFTTKGIMLGYITYNNKKIQLLDTPGTLNRFDKMNIIEKQAWLAIKHAANVIIFIFDLTEPFPLKEQEKLLDKIKELGKPVIIYLSKTDILDRKKVDEFRKRYNSFIDADELKKEILTHSR